MTSDLRGQRRGQAGTGFGATGDQAPPLKGGTGSRPALRCPLCGYTETPPIARVQMAHLCPKSGRLGHQRRMVALEPVPAEQLTLGGAS